MVHEFPFFHFKIIQENPGKYCRTLSFKKKSEVSVLRCDTRQTLWELINTRVITR